MAALTRYCSAGEQTISFWVLVDPRSIRKGGWRMRAALIAILAAVATSAGCGKSDERPPTVIANPDDGGAGNEGGSGNEGGAAGNGGAADNDPNPQVRMLAPEPLSDLEEGEPLTGSTLVAICKAVPGAESEADEIEQSAVLLELLGDGELLLSQPADAGDETDTFQTTFLLTDVPPGPITVRCTATSGETPILTGTAEVESFLDKGPAIEVMTPVADDAYSLRTPLSFDFSVTESELTEDDSGATIESVTVRVDGREIDDLGNPDDAGTYSFEVDLEDATIFNPLPTGESAIQIVATNARGVSARAEYFVLIDGTPPTIAATPLPEVVGGKVTLQFTASDEGSGVDASTVLVTINSRQFYYDPAETERWSYDPASGSFFFVFDEGDLAASTVQASITIDAKDQAGNSTTEPPQLRGASLLVYLDNQPPIVSLDPPSMREGYVEDNVKYCSNTFDPVGDASPNDGETVTATTIFRALVWDWANGAEEDDVVYYAQTDPASVRLFMQDELDTPLLIDRTDDGVCDDINSEVTSNPVRYLELVAMPEVGAPPYQTQAEDLEDDPSPIPANLSDCTYKGDADPPDQLCPQQESEMTRIIRHTSSAGEPVIYAINPDFGDLECTGRYWELGAVVDREQAEGWLCLAVRASDNVHNVGVSRPLRVCYDDPRTTHVPDCVGAPLTEAPSCTDGCTPPDDIEMFPRLHVYL